MLNVFVCCPITNTKLARGIASQLIVGNDNVVPIAPFVYFPLLIADLPSASDYVWRACVSALSVCDLVVVYGELDDWGKAIVEEANSRGIEVRKVQVVSDLHNLSVSKPTPNIMIDGITLEDRTGALILV